MLSVIIPFVNEYPQVAFTIASISEELKGIEFEVIAVDNGSTDKGCTYLEGMATVNPWLDVLRYEGGLSHWQCKNLGAKAASFDNLFFCDAHCVPGKDSLVKMLEVFDSVEGTLHLPLTYHILEQRKLIYGLKWDKARCDLHYFLGSLRQKKGLLEVPCMSTCGMMIRKKTLKDIGYWPSELGIYGGGENFLNFTLAVLDIPKTVFCDGVLHHHGERRGYSWTHMDYVRNRTIAAYIYGGKDFARRFIMSGKGECRLLNEIYEDVLSTCKDHRELVKKQQVQRIYQWVDGWHVSAQSN